MRYLSFLCIFLGLWADVQAQFPRQTVRGRVLDRDNKQALFGAVVELIHPDTSLSVATEDDGSFRFEQVPVGRINLKAEFSGYEPYTQSGLILSSAKVLEVDLELSELSEGLEQVVVRSGMQEKRPVNELSVVSTRSFSVEETQRYASSINDPSRMAMGFAGVRPSQDNNSDLIVRGNSPVGLLWRLEGIDIPNPNHFARRGSSGGGITIFSASLLANSDFSSGAFAAEYGNALSSVFDMRFRRGNNEKREYTVRLGIIGLDAGAEGPFRKGRGSYLVNYRYSTLGLLNRAGIYLVGENVRNNFQDLSFNLSFPSADFRSEFTVFGLGGLSYEQTIAKADTALWQTRNDYSTNDFITNMGAIGATYRYTLDEKSNLKTTVALMGNTITFRDDTLSRLRQPFTTNDELYNEARIAMASYYNRKFSARTMLKAGLLASHQIFSVQHNRYNRTTSQVDTLLSGQGGTQLIQLFGQVRHKLTERLSLLAGVHSLFLTLNKRFTVEPRAALKYQLAPGHSLALASGIHGRMLPIGSYFTRVDGQQPNLSLPFIKSNHNVLAYDFYSQTGLHLGIELYYQYLWDVPVGAGNDSTYWLLNDRDGYAIQGLQAKGKGFNYGIDITIEKFFDKGYFFLLANSLGRSEYIALNGRRYSTRYDGLYNGSLLAGKEWTFKRGGVLQLGLRAMLAGSLRYTPADVAASQQAQELVLDFSRNFENQVPIYYRVDGRIAYRKSLKGWAYTLAFDGQNMSMRRNLNTNRTGFDPILGEMTFVPQSGLVPVLSFQVDF